MFPITIFSAVCFITIAFCGPVENNVNSEKIYPEKCAKGQIVWCTNFTSAAECDAVNHCIQSVWLNTNHLGDGESCSSCETEIDNIRNSISINTPKQTLKEKLEHVCKVSVEYVDTYFNELLDLLRSDIDSKQICPLLGYRTTFLESSVVKEDDAVIYYKNIVLHFPARFISTKETPELLGSKRCTWGPSYWCTNITSSKECKMTSHCITKVWSKVDYNEDNDSICQICKEMIKQVREQLQSNETQEELKEVFEGSCKLIPIKEVQKECIKLADEFIPELTEMILEQLNPTVICSVAGLCNNAHIDNLLADNLALSDGFDSCTNCTIAFTAVERFLKNSPDDVLQKLLLICDQLSSYSDACSSLVFAHFDDLYTMMKTQLQTPGVCHLSGMCASKYHLHTSPDDVSFQNKVDTALATSNDDLPCDLCKQLVTHFKEILIANTTEEEFLEVLQGICEQTGKFQSECLQLVNENFKIIYKFLTEELNPSEICRDVNLCPKEHMITDESLNLIFSCGVPQIAESTKIASLIPPNSKSNSECQFCEMLIRLIQSEMKKPEFEKDIEKAIEKVCELVPSSDKEHCDNFVEQYTNELIKMLRDETDPKVICSMLGLCIEVQVEKISKNTECTFCQYILHFIQQQLYDAGEQKKIEEAVKEVCIYVPKGMQDNCKEFINQYSALIITILAQDIDPSLVCPALKLCPGLLSAEERCSHCQMLMGNFIDQLNENRNENNIKNKLKNLVAVGRRNNATAVALELTVSHYEYIIDMMMAGFNSIESCTFLQFCDPKKMKLVETIGNVNTNEIMETVSTKKEPSNVDKPSCEICELFVKMYEDKLTSNVTEKELEVKFLNYCDQIKNPEWKLNCSRVVNKYVPILLNLLKRDVKPKDLCELAKFCPLRSVNTFSIESMEECRVCEVVVGAVQSISMDPYIQQSAAKEIGKVCEVIGEKERDTCSVIVNALAPQIENVIAEIPSWYYCSKLDMCPYREYLIDPIDCSKQQSSWCKDLKTAVICDKLKHCQQNVWKSEKPSLNQV